MSDVQLITSRLRLQTVLMEHQNILEDHISKGNKRISTSINDLNIIQRERGSLTRLHHFRYTNANVHVIECICHTWEDYEQRFKKHFINVRLLETKR